MMFQGMLFDMIACFLLWFDFFQQKFNKGDITLLYNVKRGFVLNPHELKKCTKPSLSLFSQLLGHFYLFREGQKGGAGNSVYVPDVTSLNSMRGPQLVFCVS